MTDETVELALVWSMALLASAYPGYMPKVIRYALWSFVALVPFIVAIVCTSKIILK